MVTKYGMSDALGPIALEEAGGRPIYGAPLGSREHSEQVSAQIDAEVSKIMKDAELIAHKTITAHRKALDAIAKCLVDTETIEQKEFEEILIANGITPKKKQDIEHQP
jgi:cell division protease FtsH